MRARRSFVRACALTVALFLGYLTGGGGSVIAQSLADTASRLKSSSGTFKIGAVSDGQVLQRSGATVIGVSSPATISTTLGDTIYGGASGALTRLAGNTTTTRKFLEQTGNGAVSAAPAWDTVTKTDVGLSSVENTALSTWAGTSNITTVGTVTTGTWSATVVARAKGGTGRTVTTWLEKAREDCITRAGLSAGFNEWSASFTDASNYSTTLSGSGAAADATLKGGVLQITTGATGSSVARVTNGPVKLTTNQKTERWCLHSRVKVTANPGTNDGNAVIAWAGGTGLYGYNGAGGDATFMTFYTGAAFVATTATIAGESAWHDYDITYDATTATIWVDDVSVGTSANTSFGTGSYAPIIEADNAAAGAQIFLIDNVYAAVNGQ